MAGTGAADKLLVFHDVMINDWTRRAGLGSKVPSFSAPRGAGDAAAITGVLTGLAGLQVLQKTLQLTVTLCTRRGQRGVVGSHSTQAHTQAHSGGVIGVRWSPSSALRATLGG